ncbi:MAG: DUF861 domain-containing protein [Myxococcales bacterium]|nr:DUF861 domain-containing protein [Myxococcales bacterium]
MLSERRVTSHISDSRLDDQADQAAPVSTAPATAPADLQAPAEPPPKPKLEERTKTCLHRTDSSSLEVREYEPGEFEWRSDADQSTCVLEGFADVDLADGRRLLLRPGAAIFLPRGMHSRWLIYQRLRTVSVCDYRKAA